MSQITLPRTTSRFGLLQISVVVLAVITGLVHLYRGLSMSLLAPPRPSAGHGFGPPRPGGFGPRPGGREDLHLLLDLASFRIFLSP